LCDERKAVIKFAISGSTAGLTDLVFLYIFYHIFFLPLVLSTSLAFILSFAVSFTMQKFWAFRNFNQAKAKRQFILYMLNAFIGLNLNGVFMHLLVIKYNVWYLLAQVIVSIVIGNYNFFIYRFVIFKKEHHEISSE
jgi:putative flippase GtrA